LNIVAGLPGHVLFVHFIVVLAPLTALLEMLCALWPAARRRLVWLVLALAFVTAALTPLTVEAGEWLFDRERNQSAILQTHAERGDWMIYFSLAMLLVAMTLAVMHWLEGRSDRRRRVASIALALVAVVVGVSSIVTVIRIGDSGAQAVWGGRLTQADN
jgi:uncharacterized membrane protein YoaK (UPF0700 family)